MLGQYELAPSSEMEMFGREFSPLVLLDKFGIDLNSLPSSYSDYTSEEEYAYALSIHSKLGAGIDFINSLLPHTKLNIEGEIKAEQLASEIHIPERELCLDQYDVRAYVSSDEIWEIDKLRNMPELGYVGNYLAKLVEAEFVADAENNQQIYENSRMRIASDIYSSITEFPLTDADGVFETTANIEAGTGRFKIFGEYYDKMFHTGTRCDVSIPLFEIVRNTIDTAALLAAEIVHSEGKSVVVFGRSPRINKQAYDRGYRGNDYIGVYAQKDGNPTFKQIWIPPLEVADYLELFTELKAEGEVVLPEKVEAALAEYTATGEIPFLNDVDLMSCSNIFSAREVEVIENFATARRKRAANNAEVVRHYAESQTQQRLNQDILPDILKMAHDLKSELQDTGELNLATYIPHLKETLRSMSGLQYELMMVLKSAMHPDGKTGSTLNTLLANAISTKDLARMAAESGFEFAGCGFSIKEAKYVRALEPQFSSWGASLYHKLRGAVDSRIHTFEPWDCDRCGFTIFFKQVETCPTCETVLAEC